MEPLRTSQALPFPAQPSRRSVNVKEKNAVTTNEQGSFVLPQLLPDTYEVRVTTAGFEDKVQTVELGVGQSRTLDLPL